MFETPSSFFLQQRKRRSTAFIEQSPMKKTKRFWREWSHVLILHKRKCILVNKLTIPGVKLFLFLGFLHERHNKRIFVYVFYLVNLRTAVSERYLKTNILNWSQYVEYSSCVVMDVLQRNVLLIYIWFPW